MWRLWMNQSYFSLGFLSQNSLWKLSKYRGYKGLNIVGWEGMWKVSFSQIRWSGDLASWLGWVMSLSRELTTWPAWDFYPVVQQLVWLFSSPACFTCVPTLAACQSQVTREFQPQVFASLHNLEHFFILSHSLILHDSHLNTGLLIAKIQANLARNKANKMVDEIQPYSHKTLRCTNTTTSSQEWWTRVNSISGHNLLEQTLLNTCATCELFEGH